MYWKKSVMTTSFHAIHFFYDSVIFHGSAWSDLYFKETVFISQHLVQPSIKTSGLVDSKKIKECVYFKKTIVALLF